MFGVERESVVAATVPLKPRPSASKPSGRFSALARIALGECLQSGGLRTARTALLLGVPEPHRIDRFRHWFDEDLVDALRARILPAFHASSAIIQHGNTSVFAGLVKARALLHANVVETCIVGGVDSFVNSADIEEIKRTWRLHREGEANGLVPGEAAAFVAVVQAGRTQGRQPLGVIAGIGLDEEDPETTVLSDGHPTGKGLLRALRKAVHDADVGESIVGLRVSDLNGERYGAMDSMLALSRFYRTHRDGLDIWHPAECVGETGAAVGALLIQLACHAFARGYSPSDTVMCEAASDSGHRAACLVRSVEFAV
jgi:3-oxoacyl-[acyl-carrier-protein] synthase-1